MTAMNTSKPLPPIAVRTLNHIVEASSGAIEANENQVRLTIGRHNFEAENNTQLLIQALELLKTR